MYSAHSPALSGSLSGGHEQHAFHAHSPTPPHHHHHHHHQQQLSSQRHHHTSLSSPTNSYSTGTTSCSHPASAQYLSTMAAAAAAAAAAASALAPNGTGNKSIQCLRFKYFATFFVCTTCLALLCASLATHKWLVSRPMRILRLNNNNNNNNNAGQQQVANFTALKLTAQERQPLPAAATSRASSQQQQQQQQRQSRFHINRNHQEASSSEEAASDLFAMASVAAGDGGELIAQQGGKFQGEIYFGLFSGLKTLNYGFGDRVSQVSVLQPFYKQQQQQQPVATFSGSEQQTSAGQSQQELVDFKLWLSTLAGVCLAILFALVGAVFAIINFVMTPRGTIAGPVGLVVWNAAACFSCLLALFSWLIEYFVRLKSNVLTAEEVQNGWTSENRSQFGYSYYFVVLAFVLHLVNIFIVSIVQAETWTNHAGKNANKRQSRASPCEGVIMLY